MHREIVTQKAISPRPEALTNIFERLYEIYGAQGWWPADTRFEVMVGAILTQNTNWKNVEKAIQQLKQHNVLSPQYLLDIEPESLAELIYSAGYFNVKARRLKHYCRWYVDAGEFPSLHMLATTELRNQLLSVNGIGPETADDILLYAFDRPVFVIDAYTRRLFSRLSLIEGDEPYEILRHWFETSLPRKRELFNEYHALIVRHAKEKCLKRPDCPHCFVEQISLNSIN